MLLKRFSSTILRISATFCSQFRPWAQITVVGTLLIIQ